MRSRFQSEVTRVRLSHFLETSNKAILPHPLHAQICVTRRHGMREGGGIRHHRSDSSISQSITRWPKFPPCWLPGYAGQPSSAGKKLRDPSERPVIMHSLNIPFLIVITQQPHCRKDTHLTTSNHLSSDQHLSYAQHEACPHEFREIEFWRRCRSLVAVAAGDWSRTSKAPESKWGKRSKAS